MVGVMAAIAIPALVVAIAVLITLTFLTPSPPHSGLGYIVGAEVMELAKVSETDYEAWRWGLRVTPVMGLLAFVLILFFIRDPPRGSIEGGQHLQATSFWGDLKDLFTK